MITVFPQFEKYCWSVEMPPKGIPTLEECIERGDFVGAQTLLDFQLRAGEGEKNSEGGSVLSPARTLAWLGWVCFHKRDYSRALDTYKSLELLDVGALEGVVGAAQGGVKCLKAACLFHLGDYEGAVAEALGAPESPLKNRTLYMSFKRLGNEAGAGGVAGKLSRDSKEDVMCLAALSFHEGRYQEALDEYKRLLSLHKEDMALNLYISLCCFKMDLYDLSLEALNSYLQAYPLSPAAINLKACNRFKLFNGKQAITELKVRGLKVLPRARVCVCVCAEWSPFFSQQVVVVVVVFFFLAQAAGVLTRAPPTHPPTHPHSSRAGPRGGEFFSGVQ